MPRTLPAELETAMDSGNYEPYLRVVLGVEPSDAGSITVEPIKFILNPLSASVIIEKPSIDPSFFRLVRGALINGTPSTISSIWFAVNEFKYNGNYVEIIGAPLHANIAETIAANSDYKTVIESTLTQPSALITNIPSYEGTATWKNYQFYKDGKPIILSPASKIFTILKQKYLILATEDGWDGIQNNIFFFVASQPRALDYEITDQLFNYSTKLEHRQLVWKDELDVVHTLGSAYKIHNLGYLETTATPPFVSSEPVFFHSHSKSSKLQVHLKYRTGDYILVKQDAYITPGFMRIQVTEIFDTETTPAWHQIIEGVAPFSNTEGGKIPSPEAASYTPITNNFDGNLDSTINNLQALADRVDDLNIVSGKVSLYSSNNDIFRVDSPGGTSQFVGSIATLPGGTTLTYNVTSGYENAMKPASTSQLAKMRLWNTTRGTYLLISNCDTSTNTLTFTSAVPPAWQIGDIITIASQTVTGSPYNYVELEIAAEILNVSGISALAALFPSAAGENLHIHPHEAYNVLKNSHVNGQIAGTVISVYPLIKIVNNVFTIAWTGTPSAIVFRVQATIS